METQDALLLLIAATYRHPFISSSIGQKELVSLRVGRVFAFVCGRARFRVCVFMCLRLNF